MGNKKEKCNIGSEVYIGAIVIFALLREIIPLTSIIERQILTYVFFFVGIAIVTWNVIIDKSIKKLTENIFLILFITICFLSTLINYHYALLANLKAIGWLLIYFFVLYTQGNHAYRRKNMIIFSAVSLIVCALAAGASLPMYYFNIDYTTLNDKMIGAVSNQGFSAQYARLWGIFADPNTASIYVLASMTIGVWLFYRVKMLKVRIPVCIAEIVMLLYIVLAGSRTALVAMLVAAFFSGAICAWNRCDENKRRILIMFGSGVICATLTLTMFVGLKISIPTTKNIVSRVVSEETGTEIHKIYDNVYRNANIEILDGYVSDADTVQNEESGEAIGQSGEKVGESLKRGDLSEKKDISNGRFGIWQDAIDIFLSSPIVGASPRGACAFGRMHCENNSIALFGYAAHNTWLEILMGTGLVGFMIALMILLSTFSKVMKNLFEDNIDIDIAIPIIVITELLCASILLSDIFFIFSFGGVSFWYCIGIVDGKTEQIRKQEYEKLKRERVLIYGPKDPIGGVEKVVYEYVCRIVKNYPDIAFDYIEYGNSFSMEEKLRELGCRVLYVPSRSKFFLKYKKAIRKVFEDTPYRAVWGSYSGLTNIDLMVYGKKYCVPKRIAHSHATRLYWGSSIMKYVVYILHHINYIRIKEYATEYWACSSAAGEFMFPTSVQAKVKLVNNAVQLERFAQDEQLRCEVRQEFNLDKGTLVIGHVARMCEVKNQVFLLEVLKNLVDLRREVKLLFIGDGELHNKLYTKVAELGLEDYIIFTGERNDVPRLLNGMDIFVLSSLAEGLSVSAIEAQAAGLPCILPTSIALETDISGLVTFLELDAGALKWAEEIVHLDMSKTIDYRGNIVKNGYDLTTASELLYKRLTEI